MLNWEEILGSILAMSPRQISYLTSHADGAWSAHEQRHFEGKPFEADITTMPFYGTTAGEEARLRASVEAIELTRASRANPLLFSSDNAPKAAGSAQVVQRPASPAKKKHRPDALSFLDIDSPIVTKDSITRVVAEVAGWRSGDSSEASRAPSASRESRTSPLSSVSSDSSVGSDGSLRPGSTESEAATSPATSEKGDDDFGAGSPTPRPTPTSGAGLHIPDFSSVGAQQRKYRAYRYGTPEMPRGKANLPHLPPSALNYRVPAPGHVKHLPRAEKLPLTGYELLASQLSSHSSHVLKFRRGSVGAASAMGSHGNPISGRDGEAGGDDLAARNGPLSGGGSGGSAAHFSIKPLYRKFEALNHRILLHLQDELSELEEQLHRLDTADTQTRRLQNSILPASRRAEVLGGGELQWQKTDILGKIGYKLGQYNHVLSSFTETQGLASPTLSDVHAYRTYLDTQQPIAEIETRFLDASDDLVTLATARTRPSGPSLGMSMSSPSCSCLCSSSGSEESLSPSYIHSLTGAAVAPMTSRQPEPLFAGIRRPISPANSSVFGSTGSPAPLSSHSRATTAIFDKESDKPATGDIEGVLPRTEFEINIAQRGPGQGAAPSPDTFLHLAVAAAVAVLVPVLTFSLIPVFSGRMAVVVFVASAMFSVQVQAGTVQLRMPSDSGTGPGRNCGRELVYCAAVYGAVMAVMASVCT